MKTAINALPLVLSLIACGSVDPTVASIQGPVTSANRSLTESTQQLTAARKDVLGEAYMALDKDELAAERAIVIDFRTDELFAQVSLSDILPVRLSRPVTLIVPAGTTSEPSNPNRAHEFYVRYDATSTSAEQMFGPFFLIGQEGSPCGGFAGLSCAGDLECVVEATYADAAGTCEVTSKE